MPVAGDIAAEARTQIPVTWDALSGDSRYGDTFLQRKVDLVKRELFGEVVPAASEVTDYEPVVIEYAGKLVALKVIPAGADYWASQRLSDSSGQRTTATWADRVQKLWDLRERIAADADEMLADVEAFFPTVIKTTSRKRVVGITPGDNDAYATPNPTDFPRQAVVPTRTAA